MAASDLIQFKRGTLANLQAKMTEKSGEDGCFYLTIDNGIDSSRLFIGRADGSIVPVNQGIVRASTLKELEDGTLAGNFQSGDFAYVASDNILAVRSGNQWIQINEAVDTHANNFTTTISVENGVVTVLDTVSMNAGSPHEDSFTIQGANGTTVSASGDAITVSGEKYELSRGAVASNASVITLASDKQDSAAHDRDSSITIEGGDNVTVTTPSAGVIHLESKDTQVDNFTSKGLSTNGFEFDIIQGALTPKTATIDPQIKVGVDSTKQQTIHFIGNDSANSALATLPVYTSAEIDEKIQAVNAMAYKGTVGTGGSYADNVAGITASGKPALHIGDTFKVTEDMSLTSAQSSTGSGVELRAGDLLIANGTEDANGEITSNLKYDVVPAGDDPDTTYAPKAALHGVKLDPSTVGASDIDFFALANTDGLITLTDAANDGASSAQTVTLGHGNVTRTDTNNTSGNAVIAQAQQGTTDITVVSGVTTSDQGHVTGVTTQKITLIDTQASLNSVTAGVAAANNVATVTTGAVLSHGSGTADEKSAAYTIASDNLTVTAPTTTQVKMNFVWGTF